MATAGKWSAAYISFSVKKSHSLIDKNQLDEFSGSVRRISKNKTSSETDIFFTWTRPVGAVSHLSLGATARLAAKLRRGTIARSLPLPGSRTATGCTRWPHGPWAPNAIYWKEKKTSFDVSYVLPGKRLSNIIAFTLYKRHPPVWNIPLNNDFTKLCLHGMFKRVF